MYKYEIDLPEIVGVNDFGLPKKRPVACIGKRTRMRLRPHPVHLQHVHGTASGLAASLGVADRSPNRELKKNKTMAGRSTTAWKKYKKSKTIHLFLCRRRIC